MAKFLPLVEWNSKMFAHDSKRKTLSAERSDFPTNDLFLRLYGDAYDRGIAIRNENTGNVTVWYVTGDCPGCQLGWILKPVMTEFDLKYTPILAGYEMTIFND